MWGWYIAVILTVCWSHQQLHASPECQLSKWSTWGRCMNDPPCQKTNVKIKSYPKPTSKKHKIQLDSQGLKPNTKAKIKLWNDIATCQAKRTCPKYDGHVSDGPKACVNGLAGIYPCRNVDRLSFLSIKDLGNVKKFRYERMKIANDLWGWTDPKTKEEYALVGTSSGTSFVRLNNPEHPEVVGFLYTSTGASSWRDVKVINSTAYIVSEARGHGMQVFDLNRLRGQKKFQNFTADYWYKKIGSSHNIVANPETGYLYIVGARTWGKKIPLECAAGLHIINAKDRLRPRFEACYSEDGYTHDAQCVIYNGIDKRFVGRELCFNYNEDSLTIVDVTNHKKPVMVSKRGYKGSQYTHQGWLTEDQRVLLMDDELDEYRSVLGHQRTRTLVWDVSDLKNPELKHEHISNERSIDHNQYTLGDYTFQSNYESGLRILHIDENSYHLREVGYFDVTPAKQRRASFIGSWSNYPYFASGVIPVSSIRDGLFILKPDYKAMYRDSHPTSYRGVQVRSRDIVKAKNGASCPALEQRRLCTPPKICKKLKG